MSFEAAYLALRRKEGRVYPDEILEKLPLVPKNHPLTREWKIRQISLERLMGHLRSLDRPLRILDLGCGNGWVSRHLSHLPKSTVLGTDLGEVELDQARRVFDAQPNLSFQRLDIFKDDPRMADIVVMGASIQYFPDLEALLKRLNTFLHPKGEIHIVDTPFYPEKEIPKAKARTEKYYSDNGFPELSAHYHHHAWTEIEKLGGQLMYNPHSFSNKLRTRLLKQVDTPFPWWVIPKGSFS